MDTSRGDCFVCTMMVMDQDLIAAGSENWEFANETFRRLEETCEAYEHSESDHVSSSACTLHRGEDVNRTEVLWKVVDLLMESFEVFNQRDETLAPELLRLAYYFTDMYKTGVHRCRFWCECLISRSEMLPVSEFRQLMRAAYSAQHSASADEVTDLDDRQHIAWFAIKKRKEQLLSGLLRYGVMFRPATQFIGKYFGAIIAALRCLDEHSKRTFTLTSKDAALDIFRRELRWPQHRVIIVVMVMQILSFQVCESRRMTEPKQAESGRKRPRLEGSGEDSPSDSAYFRCLRRAFDTIPEPFVTSEELRRVYQVACGVMDEGTETRIEGALAMFEKWYPEGAGPLAPRTLQHLGRCQVRQNLRHTGALPHGIRHLVIPDKIRKYITLDE